MSIKNVGKGLRRWATVCGLVLRGPLPGGLPDPLTPDNKPRSRRPAPSPLPLATPRSRPTAAASNRKCCGVGDSLTVTFTDTPTTIPPFQQKIKGDGTITLALNQTFKADGKTVGDLEKEIRAFYVPDYYKYLTVTVTPVYPEDIRLKRIASRCVTIAQSGQYNLLRSLKRAELFTAQASVTQFCTDMYVPCVSVEQTICTVL